MIVDDDPQLLEELKSSLAGYYEIFTLQDSKEVLETANKLKPDIILIDVKMPGESGLQLACKIKSFSELIDTKIIVMSGNSSSYKYQVLSELCGFQGFLPKPFSFKELQSKLEEA